MGPETLRFCLAAIVSFALIGPSMASCLEDAASFAERVCGEISSKGSSQLVSGSGALSAEARGLIARMLGSAQASGNIDAAVTSYENVTREELAKEHASVRDCREQMIIVAIRQVCPEVTNTSSIPPSKRTEVLNKIAEFMEEGQKIMQTFIEKDDPSLIKTQYATWATNTHNYLQDLGASYAAQFDTVHGGGVLPMGKSMEGGYVWAEINAKTQALSAVLGEIRRGE